MLSYQHAYHAGGAADLHKHAALTAALDRLAEKHKPFVVIDLYAGHGLYDLMGPEAAKTGEFTGGIGRLWPPGSGDCPDIIARLLARVAALNPDGRLRRYPGSPALARAALRTDDRMILNELHPAALADLKAWAARDPRIAVHRRDGLEALLGLTPPAIRRGLVLIDPSYEVKSEYETIPETLAAAVRKWPQGTYLVWYPVLAEDRHRLLIDGIRRQVDADIFQCELTLPPAGPGRDGGRLRGTGIVAVNPPWRFDALMDAAGGWLARRVTHGGAHAARWLKGGDAA